MEQTGVNALHCDAFPYLDRFPAPACVAWEEVGDQQAPVFLRPEWLAMAIEARAVERGMILVFRNGARPLGVMPLQYRTRWSAEICAPLAPDMMPLIVAPGAEEPVWRAFAEWFRQSPFALIRLGRFLPEQCESYRRLIEAQGVTTIVRPANPLFRIDLPDSWEAYLGAMKHRDRYNIRHAERKILADFPDAEISVSDDPAVCAGDLDTLIRLSCLRWQGEKHRSHLENPRLAAMLRRFTLRAVEQGGGCVAALRVGGRTIAVATAIHIPGQSLAFYHTVGRDPAALPRQYSPGMLLSGRIVRWAIERGAARISLSQGNWLYKQVLGGVEHPQCDLCVASSPLAAKVMKKVDPAVRLVRLRAQRMLGWGKAG